MHLTKQIGGNLVQRAPPLPPPHKPNAVLSTDSAVAQVPLQHPPPCVSETPRSGNCWTALPFLSALLNAQISLANTPQRNIKKGLRKRLARIPDLNFPKKNLYPSRQRRGNRARYCRLFLKLN